MRQVHTYSGVKLAAALGIDRDTALQIIRLVRDMDIPTIMSHPEAQRRYRECYHHPGYPDIVLHVIDALLDTCGVEGWCLMDSYTEGVSYCNAGDTYSTTIFLSPDDQFYVCCLAEAAERWPSGD